MCSNTCMSVRRWRIKLENLVNKLQIITLLVNVQSHLFKEKCLIDEIEINFYWNLSFDLIWNTIWAHRYDVLKHHVIVCTDIFVCTEWCITSRRSKFLTCKHLKHTWRRYIWHFQDEDGLIDVFWHHVNVCTHRYDVL